LETLNENSVYGFRFARRLLTQQTKYQYLELLESPDMGKTLRLDGCLMTAETEEFFYHEGLVHPAAIALDPPRSALIVGGEDGGALEELLQHSMQILALVVLVEDVLKVSREHRLSTIKGAIDDPRVTVRSGVGAQFAAQTDHRFDMVFLDLTYPETLAGPLY